MGMVTLKGRGKEIELAFKENITVQEALCETEKLLAGESFFECDDVKISYSGLSFTYNDEMLFEKSMKKLFKNGATLIKQQKLSKRQIEYSLGEGERVCLTVDRSLRSGEEICFDGDVTIYGDVNPGALVRANGNITVIGALRGSAHIKTDGRVYATYMQPAQIRIGKLCSYNKNGENVNAAVALTENGEIILRSL